MTKFRDRQSGYTWEFVRNDSDQSVTYMDLRNARAVTINLARINSARDLLFVIVHEQEHIKQLLINSGE